MEVLTEAPQTSSFIALADHQSATPVSFYAGPPVLHYYSDRCQITVLESEAANVPALLNLVSKAPARVGSETPQNGTGADAEQRKLIEDVDVWVTSDTLLMYSRTLATGLSIPYPTISLHAIQSLPSPSATDAASQGLYMQLIASPDGTSNTTQSEDIDVESVSMTVVPTASAPPQVQQATGEANAELAGESLPEQTPVQAMFAALSECSNLHPDPDEDEDMDMDMARSGSGGLAGSALYQSGMVMGGATDGGLPPPMPGSGGWITAENMHEYFDSEGNWIGPEDGDGEAGNEDGDDMVADGPEILGPGAGTTRQRDGGDADGDGEDETKWRRTD